MTSALVKKLFRDLWRLRSQSFAIAVVVAAGAAIFVASRGTLASLVRTQEAYYARHRLADVFARAVRVPRATLARIEELPGVAEASARVVVDVGASVPGATEPISLRLVSLPARAERALNGVYLRRGALPERDDELVLNEAFADAARLDIGATLSANIHGRKRRLRVVGVGMSPEYVFQMRGTELLPDDRRFGVAWMEESALAAAMDMSGAFNDLSLLLTAGAQKGEVIARLDEILAPYGGLGAGGRDELVSHRYLTEELKQLDATARMIPTIFLGVAAFLLNVVLARLVATQRSQIGTLKAFGYSDLQVGLHYLELVMVIVALGALAGVLTGVWMGFGLTEMYRTYYRFPDLAFSLDVESVVSALAITIAASCVGALGAVRGAVRLPPAEAMRPEPPPVFRARQGGFARAARLLSTTARMTLRNLGRRPARSAMSVAGVAMAAAILVVGGVTADAIDVIAEIQFDRAERQDITVVFAESEPVRAAWELGSATGALRVEPFRAVPVTLRHGPRAKKSAIMGITQGASLKRVVDRRGEAIAPPPEGMAISRGLADWLGVGVGDTLDVEIMEGRKRTLPVAVSVLVDDLMGYGCTMDFDALTRLVGGAPRVSGVAMDSDEHEREAILARLERTAAVASVSLRQASIEAFYRTVNENMAIFYVFEIVLAVIIAFSVVFNNARVALSERARELATMRVLGFTEAEAASVLVGEIVIITAAAVPLGLLAGYGFALLLVESAATELMRLPLAVSASTYALAAIVVSASTLASALVVSRRVKRLDLVGVLKTRD